MILGLMGPKWKLVISWGTIGLSLNLITKRREILTMVEGNLLQIGMTVWWVGTSFTFPSIYHTPIYLSVTLLIINEDEKSNLIPILDGFRYLCPISAVNIFFLIKVKTFFIHERNVVILYPREAESVRYGRRKYRSMISECHLKDWYFDCVSEMI